MPPTLGSSCHSSSAQLGNLTQPLYLQQWDAQPLGITRWQPLAQQLRRAPREIHRRILQAYLISVSPARLLDDQKTPQQERGGCKVFSAHSNRFQTCLWAGLPSSGNGSLQEPASSVRKPLQADSAHSLPVGFKICWLTISLNKLRSPASPSAAPSSAPSDRS